MVLHKNRQPRAMLHPRLFCVFCVGGDLLSHLKAVPSALGSLTTLFGMGRGDPPRYSRQLLFILSQDKPSNQIYYTFNKQARGLRFAISFTTTRDFLLLQSFWEAFGQLVALSSRHHCPSTCALSTWSSPTALTGVFILELASHLDAFSAYPFRT